MFVDSQSTRRFFTSLPVLEDLTLEDCKWNNLHDISMCFQNLKSLGIICDTLDEDEPIECMIKVHALNLRSLKCSYNLDFELLHEMHSLVDASIGLRDDIFDHDIDFEPAMKLISRIQLVQSLAISDSTFGCLARVDNFEAVLPLFSKLTHLEVTSKVYFYNRKVVEAILHKSPNLEFLTLGQGTAPQRLVYEEDWWFKPAPICIKSKLKRFSISHYSSFDAENYLIAQLLKDGSVLEKMTIVCGKYSIPTLEQVEQLRNEFQTMPRASVNCVIQIS